mmetsp:Transcript_12551/g.21483  ORF Transcript_12551/g.21483 Transcript_12551/m.21483 type:complete len:265 (+) Transcript_12551:1195-1989(+)
MEDLKRIQGNLRDGKLLHTHELLIISDANRFSPFQGYGHATAIGDEALSRHFAPVLRGIELDVGLGGIVVVDLGTWEDFVGSSCINLLQLRLDGSPGLGHELITAGVQDHVQRNGGRPNAQSTDGGGTTDVLTEGEGKAAVGDTRIGSFSGSRGALIIFHICLFISCCCAIGISLLVPQQGYWAEHRVPLVRHDLLKILGFKTPELRLTPWSDGHRVFQGFELRHVIIQIRQASTMAHSMGHSQPWQTRQPWHGETRMEWRPMT